MKKLSEEEFKRRFNKIIGLGETSTRKSYYPELQKRIAQLEQKNKVLEKEISARKKAQKELANSKALYKTLAENVTEGVMITSKGTILYVNPPMETIFRISREKFVQTDLTDIVHPDYHDLLKNLRIQNQKGETTDIFTALCIRGDGNDVWIQGNSQPIEWQGNTATMTTILDITAQKEKEAVTLKVTEELQNENLLLKSRNMHRYGLGSLVGTSESMQQVYDKIIKCAAIEENVVLYGESGTGKELVARSIHDLSRRKDEAFVAVNCGAIPENLFESEFFGHKKGAFTGAGIDKAGFFETAHNGTLFLDEIGEIPQTLQVKLLRVIEGNGYTPLGSTEIKTSNVRIIAATNRDLKQLVEAELFREDLYYRIHIIPIQLPPLKDRKEDIPLLTYHFVQKIGGSKNRKFIPDAIVRKFQEHDWPGNVRELQNTVSRYLALETIDFAATNPEHSAINPISYGGPADTSGSSLKDLLDRYEKSIIAEALRIHEGNKSRVAQHLGIDRKSLHRKIARLHLDKV